MASEWQTVSSNKKKTKGNVTHNIAVPVQQDTSSVSFAKVASIQQIPTKPISSISSQSTKSIIKYSEEEIYRFKEINKQQGVSYDLSVYFDKINEMFSTSTQYLESKKKINHNQSNHNYWQLKKDEDNSVINIICINLNKITEERANEIIQNILSQDIILYDDLEKLVDKMIHQCISQPQFIKLYIRVIESIIIKCAWIVEDKNMIPTTYRKVLLNQLEVRFTNLLNDIKNMKYEDSESELIVIHNKQRKGLISMICELYDHRIIGNQLIRYIFKTLESAYESTGLDQYIEYWSQILNTVMFNWLETEKQYLDEEIQYIKSKKISTLKIKFMIDDIISELERKAYIIKPSTKIMEDYIEVNYSDVEDSYDLHILAHDEYETTDEWFASLDKNIYWDKFLLDLLQITLVDKKELNLVKKLIKYVLDNGVYTKEQILNKMNYIRSNNDFSEYRYYLKDLQEIADIL